MTDDQKNENNELERWLYGGGAEAERKQADRDREQAWLRQMFSGGQQETPRSRAASDLLDLVGNSPSVRRLRKPDDASSRPAGPAGSPEEIEALREWLRPK